MPLPQIREAGEFVVRSGWTLGPRTISDYELVYFPQGSKTGYRCADQTYILTERCFILTKPGEEHAYMFDPEQPTRHLFVHFVTEDGELPEAVRDMPPLVPAEGDSFAPALLRQLLYVAVSRPQGWQMRCQLLLLTAMHELADRAPQRQTGAVRDEPTPPQVTQALAFIDAHLADPITVGDLARHVEWSHEHFTRRFAKCVGLSPQEAIMRRRIDRASELLVREKRPVKAIAFDVGFRDEHYFSRVFKSLKGTSPTAYREAHYNPRYAYLAPADTLNGAYPVNSYIYFE